MKYGFQVQVYDHSAKAKAWKWVRPTNGAPYQYDTKEEARRMADMCYPDEYEGVRVWPFDGAA